ncbi:MAG: pirin family protein [Candidatus Gracilibacteria bacterium]|nr:pirin family protein [Candidatus Gracilibacteria bacterium]
MKNRIIKSIYRFAADHGWLKSWHIFSFADYYDPSNMHFGNMRVFNDDFIEGKSGFGMHAHSNMEILTIMLEGEITHTDNMGNKATIKKGQIQTMSAGTGIRHSEENRSDKLVHLYQIWFLPTHNGNTPEYKDIDIKIENNKLNLLASNIEQEGLGYLDSDVKVYYGKYYKYEAFEYTLEKNRGLFLYMYKGELIINKTVLKEGDQLRFELEGIYDFISNSIDCEFVLIDVKL